MDDSLRRTVIIDNYDSFTYNLVQMVQETGATTVLVMKNDAIDWEMLEHADNIILSPGPGLPSEAGQMMEVIDRFYRQKKILGVCLGHQAIGQYFGATLINLPIVSHGRKMKTILTHHPSPIFEGLSSPFDTGRYHSWVLDNGSILDQLEVTAIDENEAIMALQHKTYAIYGVQFHPESVMTPFGFEMLKNFIVLT